MKQLLSCLPLQNALKQIVSKWLNILRPTGNDNSGLDTRYRKDFLIYNKEGLSGEGDNVGVVPIKAGCVERFSFRNLD